MGRGRFLSVAATSAVMLGSLFFSSSGAADSSVVLRGRVTDDHTGQLLPARVYIQSSDGRWYFAKSASPDGSAVEYRKQRSPVSVEMHTTLSAHPFMAELPPGQYTVTIERGKEYFPAVKSVTLDVEPQTLEFKLHRWINMAQRGWYSGDTHVHRSVEELPNVMLAEDLNVALPLTDWVTTARTPPNRGNKNASTRVLPELIQVDATHVIYPVNTEYEIFTVGGKRHTLGAVFILNHKRPLELGVPPVGPIAEEARRQGALLDLDKHSWPWSLMLVPVMNVDLFELANNHVWRTEFYFRQWTLDTKPEFMNIETDENGLMTEGGWIDYGFKTYYVLLNCGFRMRPSAGTASGVHPVPLGFGRVYVHLPDGFDYNAWIDGLNAGRSFVTTGPMLVTEFNGRAPGHVFQNAGASTQTCRVTGSAESAGPLDRIEMIVNGEIRQTIKPENRRTDRGAYQSVIDEAVKLDGSSWVAVRCFEKQPEGRMRFAHTAPVHFDVPERPLRPRREAVHFLIQRMEEELARNKAVLQPQELDDYRKALRIYHKIAETAK